MSSSTPVENPVEQDEEMLKRVLLHPSSLLRAPQHLGMKVLDREAFTKRIPTVAAYIKDKRNIQRIRKAAGSVFLLDPLDRTVIDPKRLYGDEGKQTYIIPLLPSVNVDDESSIPADLAQLVKEDKVELVPKEGILTYADFGSEEILKSILPRDRYDGIHRGFTLTGHIAHLNIHGEFTNYKEVIAQVIMDKNPTVETVVSKIEDVGSHSEFRTFPMEILAGKTDTQVSLRSSGCHYDFDFAKVYWNSRLENEHDRVANLCAKGDAVCDVMAGVGPFAIPAARHNRALVWANDLNGDSYESMVRNVEKNRVSSLVYPFNTDGREFIRLSSKALLRDGGKTITFDPNPPNAPRDPAINSKLKPVETYTIPKVFKRFIMNLPASAVEFLDAYIGLYAGLESLFQDPSKSLATPGQEEKYPLPIIHVYTFNRHNLKDIEEAAKEICQVVSGYLDYPMRVERTDNLKDLYAQTMQAKSKENNSKKATISGGAENAPSVPGKVTPEESFSEGGISVGYVRAVAPVKSMYCVSFRLPWEVAFRTPPKELSEMEKKLEQMKSIWLRSDETAQWPGKLKQ
ncbi:tRNA(m(1)G37)methyltransferase [Orbilia oligospora]|uniref:tRNA (guanine(37)-N1)-methyltransferase n=2 Tax=Orbilia oligospora TaxID=2813651 RepID=A0A7C8U5I4_ORBOL|nr:tRNA(m(1)G37)methyltransferase [Orbilia oligospora]KAF3209385.1 tRNA(m(1)G37)methyltransferase [Orbilia oligospora]KAF3215415.1 tRNA(m(1)G37)methyltransferase [Orbilia oligospora]